MKKGRLIIGAVIVALITFICYLKLTQFPISDIGRLFSVHAAKIKRNMAYNKILRRSEITETFFYKTEQDMSRSKFLSKVGKRSWKYFDFEFDIACHNLSPQTNIEWVEWTQDRGTQSRPDIKPEFDSKVVIQYRSTPTYNIRDWFMGMFSR